MANLRMTIGQVNITDWLIIRLRKTTAPLAVVASEAYSEPHPVTRNVVVPASGSIDPDEYYIDLYESSNGITLGLLLGQFVHKITETSGILEWRFYKVGNGGTGDPIPDTTTLTDPYFIGKTISAVFKPGYGPLTPEPYTFKEYDFATDTITLLNGQIFSNEEIWSVLIENPVSTSTSARTFFNNVITLTTSTVLSSTHYNARLRCEGTGGLTQVHTLPDPATVPDGTIMYFMQNRGNQNQTKLITAAGLIVFGDGTRSEITIGKGEWVHLECRLIGATMFWEVVGVHHAISMVGERWSAGFLNHPNCMPEDGRLLDGDEWPRIWWWITSVLTATHTITSDSVILGGYTHPVGQEGLFVRHSSLKKFRMPNTQELTERGLKDMDTYNTDAERVYDYPGGVQHEQVGPHLHYDGEADNSQHSSSSSQTSTPSRLLVNNGPAGHAKILGFTSGPVTGNPTHMRTKNIGVIYMRRI
jgi:hypothetical protein